MDKIDKIGSAFLRAILLRMKELGINQTELARRMEVSRPYITKVLRQDVNFSFRTAAKLAQALKMDFMPILKSSSEEVSADDANIAQAFLSPELGAFWFFRDSFSMLWFYFNDAKVAQIGLFVPLHQSRPCFVP